MTPRRCDYIRGVRSQEDAAGTLAGRSASGSAVLVPPENQPPTLADLGISKLSADAQRLADATELSCDVEAVP